MKQEQLKFTDRVDVPLLKLSDFNSYHPPADFWPPLKLGSVVGGPLLFFVIVLIMFVVVCAKRGCGTYRRCGVCCFRAMGESQPVLPSYTPQAPTPSRNYHQTNYNMVPLSPPEVPEVLPPTVRKALMPPPMAIVPVQDNIPIVSDPVDSHPQAIGSVEAEMYPYRAITAALYGQGYNSAAIAQ